MYGGRGLFILETTGDVQNIFLSALGYLAPTSWLVIVGSLLLISIAILGIFFHKKRGYVVLLGSIRVQMFASMLFVVVKTYNYLPQFVASVIAGTLLVVGGFAARYACFWGYKNRKLLPYRVPSLIWIGSFLLFCGILQGFPGPAMTVDYRISMGVEQAVVMAPWTLDSKEFIFAGGFLLLLRLCRFAFQAILRFPLLPAQKTNYQRKLLAILIGILALGLGVFLRFKRAMFVTPTYDLHQYDARLTKSGYQANIATGDNGFYRQNDWFIAHTGFLRKIESELFVHENYFSQGTFPTTGFTHFWNAYSGEFHQEFLGIATLASGYAMVEPADADWPLAEERTRERTHLAGAVARALCEEGDCAQGFSYRRERALLTQNRLAAGQGVMGTLISIVSMQDVLSGAQEILPYLSPSQKQLMQSTLLPLDVDTIYKNMLVQEYAFVSKWGLGNMQRGIHEQALICPKWAFDIDYTDAQIKSFFAQALLNPGKDSEISLDLGMFVYNFKGNELMKDWLPRVGHIYTRLQNLENVRKKIFSM